MISALEFYRFLLERFGFNNAIVACVARAINVAFGRDGTTAIQRVNAQVSSALLNSPPATRDQGLVAQDEPEPPIAVEKKRPSPRQNIKRGARRKKWTSQEDQDDAAAND